MATGKAEAGQQIGQVRGCEEHGEGSIRAGHSGRQGWARWIVEEGRKKNRAKMAEQGDVTGQGSPDGGETEIRSPN